MKMNDKDNKGWLILHMMMRVKNTYYVLKLLTIIFNQGYETSCAMGG